MTNVEMFHELIWAHAQKRKKKSNEKDSQNQRQKG